MTQMQESEHKSISYINRFIDDQYPLYSIDKYKDFQEKSGIFMLFTKFRLVYIGTSTNVYNSLYLIFSDKGSSSLRHHFLYDQICQFSFIEISPYTRRISEDIKRSLLERFRPVLNYGLNEFKWYEDELKYYTKQEREAMKKHVDQKNEELQKLREEYEKLQNNVDDLISAAMKFRKEK